MHSVNTNKATLKPSIRIVQILPPIYHMGFSAVLFRVFFEEIFKSWIHCRSVLKLFPVKNKTLNAFVKNEFGPKTHQE